MARSPTLEADLNFACDPSFPGSFSIPFITRVPSGETLYVRTHKVPLHNLREDAYQPSFDVTGFTWQTVPFDGINSGAGWEDQCAKEACQWLKAFLGARACAPMNWNLRQRTVTSTTSNDETLNNDDQAFKTLAQEPSCAVHIDVNRERVADEVLKAFGPGTPYTTADRLAMMQVFLLRSRC